MRRNYSVTITYSADSIYQSSDFLKKIRSVCEQGTNGVCNERVHPAGYAKEEED